MDATMVQDATTVAVVLAGLFFSFACALLVEELVFGAIFHWFSGRNPAKSHGPRNAPK